MSEEELITLCTRMNERKQAAKGAQHKTSDLYLSLLRLQQPLPAIATVISVGQGSVQAFVHEVGATVNAHLPNDGNLRVKVTAQKKKVQGLNWIDEREDSSQTTSHARRIKWACDACRETGIEPLRLPVVLPPFSSMPLLLEGEIQALKGPQLKATPAILPPTG